MSERMSNAFRRQVLALAFWTAIGAWWVPEARGDVVVLDRVSSVGTPVSLAIQTTRLFMSDGGRLVDIYLNDERLGRIMTGADGYGYARIVPQAAGLQKIRARMNDLEGSGCLLVMGSGEKAVVVELEAAFMEVFRHDRGLEDSRKALESIRREYRLIYAYRLMGSRFSRNRLEAAGWPASVVLPWRGQTTLESLREKGVQVHAVIGSAETVTAASRHVEKRFSFGKSKGSKTVADWAEVVRGLELSPDVDPEHPHD